MIQDPQKRARLRSTLIIIILAALPCYILGLIVLWVGSTSHKVTPTITLSVITQVSETPALVSPTLPIPSAQFPTKTRTDTPTTTSSPTITITYSIPTSTASYTPTPSVTTTNTPEPTLAPTDTPVFTNTIQP
jgi:hypothetical protein